MGAARTSRGSAIEPWGTISCPARSHGAANRGPRCAAPRGPMVPPLEVWVTAPLLSRIWVLGDRIFLLDNPFKVCFINRRCLHLCKRCSTMRKLFNYAKHIQVCNSWPQGYNYIGHFCTPHHISSTHNITRPPTTPNQPPPEEANTTHCVCFWKWIALLNSGY